MQSGADSVATRTTSEGTLVLLSGQPLFVVTAADVDTAIGESMGTRAAASANQLRMAVEEVRESGSVTAILSALGLALVATALLVLVIRLLVAGRRRLEARLGRVTVTARLGLTIRGFTLLRGTQLLAAARVAIRAIV